MAWVYIEWDYTDMPKVCMPENILHLFLRETIIKMH
jgi:hypothetical protein